MELIELEKPIDVVEDIVNSILSLLEKPESEKKNFILGDMINVNST